MTDVDRLWSEEAEKAVVGAIVVSRGNLLGGALAGLAPEAFYLVKARQVVAAALALQGDGLPVDRLAVADRLGGASASAVGDWLDGAMDAVPTVAHAGHYWEIVRRLWRKRAVVDSCRVAAGLAVECGDDADPGMVAMGELLPWVGRSGGADKATQVERINDRMRRVLAGERFGVASPWASLNEVLVGLSYGEMSILAGRGSSGKTAMARQWMIHESCKGNPVGFAMLEGSPDFWWIQMACAIHRLDSRRFRGGANPASAEEVEAMAVLTEDAARLPLEIYTDDPCIDQVCAWIMADHVRRGTRFFVVDNWTQIEVRGMEDNPNERDRSVSNKLSRLAQRIDASILVLAHLTKAGGSAEKAVGEHLHGSQAIRGRARQVMLLYRETAGDDVKWVVDVEKNNNGLEDVRILHKHMQVGGWFEPGHGVSQGNVIQAARMVLAEKQGRAA
jgi:replicative DNA helicase